MLKINTVLAFKLSSDVFIMLINVRMFEGIMIPHYLSKQDLSSERPGPKDHLVLYKKNISWRKRDSSPTWNQIIVSSIIFRKGSAKFMLLIAIM